MVARFWERWISIVLRIVGISCLVASHTSAGALGATKPLPDQPAGLVLEPIIKEGLEMPTALTHAGDGTGTLYVVEQVGRVRAVQHGALVTKPFLDISDRVLAGGERGLLGLAFHPNYRENGRLFVNYTRKPDGWTVLAEYRYREDGHTAVRRERILMVVPQPYANHNGGMVAFGADGMLYIGRGDGGAGGDPGNRAQNPDELLGKILRIDVDHGDPYAIPKDNPFVRGGGRPEIFALGFRNPWRFSFDRLTGLFWVADVGQHRWEEVDLVTRGGNYGWRLMEGNHCFEPADGCSREGLTTPAVEYARQSPRCSIIGGYVYRGTALPELVGTYVFSDYCSGEVMGVPALASLSHQPASPTVLAETSLHPSSFGQDERGELYLLDHQRGGLYALRPGGNESAQEGMRRKGGL